MEKLLRKAPLKRDLRHSNKTGTKLVEAKYICTCRVETYTKNTELVTNIRIMFQILFFLKRNPQSTRPIFD